MNRASRAPLGLRGYIALAVAVCCSFVVGAAEVDAANVAVFRVAGSTVDADTRQLWTQELMDAVAGSGALSLVDLTHITPDEGLGMVGCDTMTGDCLATLAEIAEADRLLLGTASGTEEAPTLSLTYFEARSRSIILTQSIPHRPEVVALPMSSRVRPLLEGMAVLEVYVAQPASVTIDGEPHGQAPALISISSAVQTSYRIGVAFDTGETVERTIVVDAGRLVHVEVRVDDASDLPATAPRQTGAGHVDGPRTQRPLMYALLGGGGVSLVAATILGTQTLRTQSSYDDTRIQREAVDLANRGRRQAAATNALVGVGAAMIGAGVLVGVLAPRRSIAASESRLTWTPAWSEAQRGASVRFRF